MTKERIKEGVYEKEKRKNIMERKGKKRDA